MRPQADEKRENITWASVDVLDAASVTAVLPGLDVLISAYQPGHAAKDFEDTVWRSIADPTTHSTVARPVEGPDVKDHLVAEEGQGCR